MTGANLENLVQKTKVKISRIRYDAFREHLLSVLDNTSKGYCMNTKYSMSKTINAVKKIGKIADSYCSLMNNSIYQ